MVQGKCGWGELWRRVEAMIQMLRRIDTTSKIYTCLFNGLEWFSLVIRTDFESRLFIFDFGCRLLKHDHSLSMIIHREFGLSSLLLLPLCRFSFFSPLPTTSSKFSASPRVPQSSDPQTSPFVPSHHPYKLWRCSPCQKWSQDLRVPRWWLEPRMGRVGGGRSFR